MLYVNEYAYLSALSSIFNKLINMMDSFSKEQLEVLLPQLNYINEILNMDIKGSNTNGYERF